jgi:DUF177 domain-containing protein
MPLPRRALDLLGRIGIFFCALFRERVMDIKVADIPEEGLKLDLTYEAADFEGLGEEVRVSSKVKAFFSLKKIETTVYVTGGMEADIELACSRCGKPFGAPLSARFKLDMAPAESLPREEEKELHAGDLEVEFYKNGIIDLKDFLREQILLQVPMKPLCMEDCRGLCQYCGQDLNKTQCSCEPPAGHPGLAGLKDLLEK